MNIHKIVTGVATGGPLGNWFFGRFVYSLLALPLWYLVEHVLVLDTAYMLLVVGVLLIIVSTCVQLALSQTVQEKIIVDSLIGVFIALLFLPGWFKLMICTFVMFHLIATLRFYLSLSVGGWLSYLSQLPLSLRLVVDDIGIGLVTSLFMHTMYWIMH